MKKLVLSLVLTMLLTGVAQAQELKTAKLFADVDRACAYTLSPKYSGLDHFYCLHRELTNKFNYLSGYSETVVADIQTKMMAQLATSGKLQPSSSKEEEYLRPMLIVGFDQMMRAQIQRGKTIPAFTEPLTPQTLKLLRY